MSSVSVLAIDGPSGAGKGTVSRILALRLGWRYLDSGALYRVLALSAVQNGTAIDDEAGLLHLSKNLSVSFVLENEEDDHRVLLQGCDVTDQLRTEQMGDMASKIAAVQSVRDALLIWQRDFARAPGLVADGRDMGTVVFPEADVKIFLTASHEVRTKRRYNQLNGKGLSVSLSDLSNEIRKRDERDANRASAPLRPADDAVVIDSTKDTIHQVVETILKLI